MTGIFQIETEFADRIRKLERELETERVFRSRLEIQLNDLELRMSSVQ